MKHLTRLLGLVFLVCGVAQAIETASENISSARNANETNEASCILKIVDQVLGTTKHSFGYFQGGWNEIKWDQEVFYSKDMITGRMLYTVYGNSSTLHPANFKVQMGAMYGELGDSKLLGCFMDKSFELTNSDGVVLANYKSSEDSSHLYVVDPRTFTKEVPENEPRADFYKEKSYAGKKLDGETESGMEIVLDEDKLKEIMAKEGGGVIADMALSKVLQRFKNLNRAGKIIRVGARGFLLLDRAGHLVSAYDSIAEGAEPKQIAIQDLIKEHNIKRFINFGKSYLSNTGVLRPPGAYLKDFEEPHRHAQASAPAKPAEGTHDEKVEVPVVNDSLKKLLEEGPVDR